MPVFVQDYENPYSYPTKDEACKYAMAGAVRRADSMCRKEHNGRKAGKNDIGIPVDANCQSCREVKLGWSGDGIGYKCLGNVTMQCILPE